MLVVIGRGVRSAPGIARLIKATLVKAFLVIFFIKEIVKAHISKLLHRLLPATGERRWGGRPRPNDFRLCLHAAVVQLGRHVAC